jgi:CheY-like chemotaxis protein
MKGIKAESLTSYICNHYNLEVKHQQASEGYILFMAQVGLLEDNARIAKLCATLLQYSGHQVTIYDTSQKCLHALLSEGRTHDGVLTVHGVANPFSLPVEVLILDLALPEISGIDVLHCLISHPRTQTLPIILCTAATNTEVARALQVAPHAGFVEKPFKLQTLISAISTALDMASK